MCQEHTVCRGLEVGVTGVWDEGGCGEPRSPPSLPRAVAISLTFRLIHGLESRLLNASFGGHNLTLRTHTIQTLAFKLGCNFTGLSVRSAALEQVPQVRGGQGLGVARASTLEVLRGLKVWTLPRVHRPPSHQSGLCLDSCELPPL